MLLLSSFIKQIIQEEKKDYGSPDPPKPRNAEEAKVIACFIKLAKLLKKHDKSAVVTFVRRIYWNDGDALYLLLNRKVLYIAFAVYAYENHHTNEYVIHGPFKIRFQYVDKALSGKHSSATIEHLTQALNNAKTFEEYEHAMYYKDYKASEASSDVENVLTQIVTKFNLPADCIKRNVKIDRFIYSIALEYYNVDKEEGATVWQIPKYDIVRIAIKPKSDSNIDVRAVHYGGGSDGIGNSQKSAKLNIKKLKNVTNAAKDIDEWIALISYFIKK